MAVPRPAASLGDGLASLAAARRQFAGYCCGALHHAGAVPLARLLTRLSVSAPSGSFSVALTHRLGDRLAARVAGVTVFMLEWSEAHFKDSLINSSVGENYVIDLL